MGMFSFDNEDDYSTNTPEMNDILSRMLRLGPGQDVDGYMQLINQQLKMPGAAPLLGLAPFSSTAGDQSQTNNPFKLATSQHTLDHLADNPGDQSGFSETQSRPFGLLGSIPQQEQKSGGVFENRFSEDYFRPRSFLPQPNPELKQSLNETAREIRKWIPPHDPARLQRPLENTWWDHNRFSPNKEGWHNYFEGDKKIAGAELSDEAMRDILPRHSIPGHDPKHTVASGEIYNVRDPFFGKFGGPVKTTISADGLTVTNETLPGHVFYPGVIVRRAFRGRDGDWYVRTHGYGNNEAGYTTTPNQFFGPRIFRQLDDEMKTYIDNYKR